MKNPMGKFPFHVSWVDFSHTEYFWGNAGLTNLSAADGEMGFVCSRICLTHTFHFSPTLQSGFAPRWFAFHPHFSFFTHTLPHCMVCLSFFTHYFTFTFKDITYFFKTSQILKAHNCLHFFSEKFKRCWPWLSFARSINCWFMTFLLPISY